MLNLFSIYFLESVGPSVRETLSCLHSNNHIRSSRAWRKRTEVKYLNFKKKIQNYISYCNKSNEDKKSLYTFSHFKYSKASIEFYNQLNILSKHFTKRNFTFTHHTSVSNSYSRIGKYKPNVFQKMVRNGWVNHLLRK